MICSSSSCYYELSFGRQAQIGARGRFDSQKRSLLMRRVYKSFSLCIGRSPGGDFITVGFFLSGFYLRILICGYSVCLAYRNR